MASNKGIISGGVTMVAIAGSALGSGFSAWITAHPQPFWGLGGIGILVALYGFFASKPKEAETASQSNEGGNFVGRDNSGDLINAKGSYVHTGDIHHHHPPSEELPEQIAAMIRDRNEGLSQKSSMKASLVVPIVITVGPVEMRRIEHGRLDTFREGPDGKIGARIWITNERVNAKPVSGLGISLVFRRDGEIVHQVNRTFWFGLTQYERTLDVGTRECALVCMCYGNILGVYNNSRRYPLASAPSWSVRRRQLESITQTQPEYIAFDDPLEVEIAAIADNGDTLGVVTYLFTPLVGEILFKAEKL